MVYVSLLLLILGVLVLSFAYAAGHKTPFPRLSRPEFLWVPGLGLFVLAALVYLTPSVLAYNECGNACAAMDGVPAGFDWASDFNSMVPEEFKMCVDGSISDRRTQLTKMLEFDPTLDVEQTLRDEEVDIRKNCETIVVGRCVRRCYARDEVVE